MATAIVLSASFLQGKQERRNFLALSPHFWRPSWWQNGLLCSTTHQHQVFLHCHAGGPRRTSSRRDSITLFLRMAFLCTQSSNAHAAESVHSKEEPTREDLGDGSVGERLMLKLWLGEFRGFVLAYLGASKTSRNSLGFLGCLFFGLLFLREKQANAANATSLEDVQLRIQKAETELRSQTRSCVRYKLQESQLGFGSERDISLRDALQCTLVSVKSSNDEKGQKLTANKLLLETLKQQVINLTVSLEELKKYCSTSMGKVYKPYILRQGLEVEIGTLEVNLQSKAEAIDKLKVATEDHEQACNKLLEDNVVVERSLDLLNEKVLDLQAKFESLQSCLHVSNTNAGILSKELSIAATRNEILEAKFDELLRSVQVERASSQKLLKERNERLTLSKRRADVLVAELTSEEVELDREFKTASQLTGERNELEKVLKEAKRTIESLREMSSSDLERCMRLEKELPTLHEQLQQALARNASLQSACKDNTVLGELLEVSAEVEGQVNIERELAERLEKELHVSQEALSFSIAEVLDLRDSMQSRLSSQAHLQDDLTRLNEVQQAHCQALKKEKRAAAYARKQLALTMKIVTGEIQVIEELKKELETITELIENSSLQISSQAIELEKATSTAVHLADDVLALRAVLQEEQSQQMNSSRSDEVVVKPSRRRGLSKPAATPKFRRNSS